MHFIITALAFYGLYRLGCCGDRADKPKVTHLRKKYIPASQLGEKDLLDRVVTRVTPVDQAKETQSGDTRSPPVALIAKNYEVTLDNNVTFITHIPPKVGVPYKI